jgi:hypothetical protein
MCYRGNYVSLRPLICTVYGLPGALSIGIKRREREADHFPPTNAEVKNGGATL